MTDGDDVDLARLGWLGPALRRRALGHRMGLLLASGAAMALAGCTPTGFPPACPQLSLIDGASSLLRLADNSKQSDIRNLVLAAKIEAVPASCRFSGAHGVAATLRVQFAVERGPASTSRDVALRYFVAAAQGKTILDEQDYVAKGTFPPNVERMTLEGQPVDLLFPVGTSGSAAGYHIYVGFRLTKAELDANRRRGI